MHSGLARTPDEAAVGLKAGVHPAFGYVHHPRTLWHIFLRRPRPIERPVHQVAERVPLWKRRIELAVIKQAD